MFSFNRVTKFIRASLGLVKAATIFSPNDWKNSLILPVITPKVSIAMASFLEPSSDDLKYSTNEAIKVSKRPKPVALIAPPSPLKPAVAPLIVSLNSENAFLPLANIVFS